MKHTKRLLAAVMALTMVSAIAPMSAFAEDTTINQSSATQSGTMTATYDVTAKYTVTIPPSAVIADTETAATAQTIKAENVLLASGEKVVVTLSEASNTTTANSTIFNAKKGDSTVKYTIKAGSDTVALGGKVAEFESKAAEQKVDIKFIKDSTSAPTFAGTHTETLTFGIAVESPAPSLSDVFVSGTTISLQHEAIGSTVTRSFRNDDGTFTFTSNQYRQFAIMEKTDDSHFTITSTVNGDYLPSDPTYVDTFCVKYTFDTTNNTYTMTKGSNVYSSYNVTLDNIKVNDVEIPVTLTE